MKTKNLQRYLDSFAKKVVRDAKGMLSKSKDSIGKARGNTALGNSIRAVVSKDPNGFSVKFYMADYGTFLDKGVSGNKTKRSYKNYKGKTLSSPYAYTTKGPPIDILSKWIKKKGIKPKGMGRGRDKNTGRFLSGFAYLISKKIKREGIKSISFLSTPLSIYYKKLQKDFPSLFSKDVTSYLTTFTK
tara:strand:- start:10379 stop:10939 length:561 start_codon:yes stop_codon:yes gene_type:complete